MPEQPAKTARWLRRIAAVLLIALPLAALGTRFDLWPYTAGLPVAAASVLGGVSILLIALIWLAFRPPRPTAICLGWSGLLGIPALGVLVSTLANPHADVIIHNVTTDPANPPAFVAAPDIRGAGANSLDYTEQTALIQRQAYPQLSTLHSPLSPQKAYTRAVTVADKLDWKIYARAPGEGRIEAVDTTFWFGFKDDVVIRIRPADNGGSLIDLRSVSRVGGGDLGANAARIETFLQRFQRRD